MAGADLFLFLAGKIINLVSNDVQRFDEASVMGHFLYVAFLDFIVVVVLLCFKLTVLSAFAGMASCL